MRLNRFVQLQRQVPLPLHMSILAPTIITNTLLRRPLAVVPRQSELVLVRRALAIKLPPLLQQVAVVLHPNLLAQSSHLHLPLLHLV